MVFAATLLVKPDLEVSVENFLGLILALQSRLAQPPAEDLEAMVIEPDTALCNHRPSCWNTHYLC